MVENNQLGLLKKSGIVVTSKEINDYTMRGGTNAMWWAVSNCNLELATLFLQGGGDPNSRDGEENSCLHMAVKNGAVPIIFVLLDYGADLNRKNSKKVTPLYYATKRMLKLLGLE
jgi:ankyrin repeat protein